MEGSRVLILDALKHGPHASHFSIAEALDFINDLDHPAEKTYLLDFTHDVDHYDLEQSLKETQKLDISPAYDGQKLIFSKDSIREEDLLNDVKWIAVSEQVNGKLPDRRDTPAKSMV